MRALPATSRGPGLHLPPRVSVRAAAVPPAPAGRRALLLSLLGGAAALTVADDAVAVDPEAAARRGAAVAGSEPFLSRSGARGVLADEEKRLFKLRLQKEGEVIQVCGEESGKGWEGAGGWASVDVVWADTRSPCPPCPAGV